ncbi:MAG TPA: RNA polymerase sigma factor [Steroidobacteraceae bacterium]
MSKDEERYLLQALEFEGALRAFLHRYTSEEPDVEDLLQETYARLLAAASADAPEVRSIRTFSLGIARGVADEWLRQRQREPVGVDPQLEAVELGEPGKPIEEIVRRRQELGRLVTAVQGLPRRCRRVFTLRKVYGYSLAQITSRLELPAQIVAEDLTQAARHCAQVVFGPRTLAQRRTWLDRFRLRLRAHERSG